MKTLYSEEVLNETIERLNRLTADHRPLWGKMTPAQMLSHCTIGMQVARGEKHFKRIFIGYLMGGFFKKGFYNEKPMSQGSPTHKAFIRTGDHDLHAERELLISQLKAFQAGGESKCTTSAHAFFGKLTPGQWGIGMYKHTDHHLRQFGV